MEPGSGPCLIAAAQTERGGKNTCYTAGKKTPGRPRQLPLNRERRRDKALLSHSLDEEDPAVPADTVRPVFR